MFNCTPRAAARLRWSAVSRLLNARLLVLVGVLFGSPTAEAVTSMQRADAFLRPVESGRLDALSETEFPYESREMCLRGSSYVLVFTRGPSPIDGGAAIGMGDLAPDEISVQIGLAESDQDGWAWKSFRVEDYTCFRFAAYNGRARVYELRVGVDW